METHPNPAADEAQIGKPSLLGGAGLGLRGGLAVPDYEEEDLVEELIWERGATWTARSEAEKWLALSSTPMSPTHPLPIQRSK